ncbi:MAG: LysE family transporter [Bdellovibrionales bacterium]|nr:LysE family transporter [Bdellovibrionales bacterium]
MVFITLFVGGVIAGTLTAVPLGPTNLWIVRSALPPARPLRNVAAFVVGLIFFDAFYAAIAFYGYSAWLQQSVYAKWVLLAGGLALVLLGLHGLATTVRTRSDQPVATLAADALPMSEVNLAKDLWTGFLLGSNPSFVAYWVVVAGTATDYVQTLLGAGEMGALFFGIVTGDVLWYSLLFVLARKYLSRLPKQFVFASQGIISLLFVLAGALIVWNFGTW